MSLQQQFIDLSKIIEQLIYAVVKKNICLLSLRRNVSHCFVTDILRQEAASGH